jgi:poly(3-hydroxybutyrate) depolymerase
VDDVGYLRAVIAEVSVRFAVDPRRVYVTGHSDGADMAHRLACESARLDLVNDVAGPETRVSRYACPPGAEVEEWAMVGARHVFSPRLPDFGLRLLDWLESHRRE